MKYFIFLTLILLPVFSSAQVAAPNSLKPPATLQSNSGAIKKPEPEAKPEAKPEAATPAAQATEVKPTVTTTVTDVKTTEAGKTSGNASINVGGMNLDGKTTCDEKTGKCNVEVVTPDGRTISADINVENVKVK